MTSTGATAVGTTTLVEYPPFAAQVRRGRLDVTIDGARTVFHPLWLRDRSTAAGAVDPTNGQRKYEPTDLPADLRVVRCAIAGDVLTVEFSDGHRGDYTVAELVRAIAGVSDEDPPSPSPWEASAFSVPIVHWDRIVANEPDETIAALDAFFRFGCFLLRGTPAEPGALLDIAGRFGRVSPTNFGVLFDVRTVPVPIDLAYTSVALAPHTDQPYRRPSPGIQFLHTIANDAPGGESSLVDGLAAVEALRRHDPEAFDVLATMPVEYRYDVGDDVKVGRAPMIELDGDGALRQLRFSTRLDSPPVVDPDLLDVYYRGRRWLAEWFDDPARQVRFRMVAGDVAVVDNHRVLHGRTAFDHGAGRRHLQGCYIDHDGPATMWALTIRRRTGGGR